MNSGFLIIGAGIVGLSIANELKQRHPDVKVTVLEKESASGLHSSGRNSGVLHSGIYYPSETLKAKVCSQGAKEMAAFCQLHSLPLIRRGKLLVATHACDEPQLEILAQRAKDNDILVEELDEQRIKKLEPEAHSATGKALFIPSTSVGDPSAVMEKLLEEVKKNGVQVICDVAIEQVDAAQRFVKLKHGEKLGYGHVVNAAGLHADTIAHKFDFGQNYTLLPFKGIYWKLDPNAGFNIRHLIYPVPDLRVPFLGVHTTTTTDGTTYIGPTAVPAFARENYYGLEDVSAKELLRISYLLTQQMIMGRDGFRQLVVQEGSRYFKPWFAKAASAILPRLESKHLLPCNKVGIRAQMLDKNTGRMVTDFLIEGDSHSTHILNAISPAWTSAFPFARHVCDNFIDRS